MTRRRDLVVRFTFERPGFLQDGCPYRALAVWPKE
jgi:hypothetical protein